MSSRVGSETEVTYVASNKKIAYAVTRIFLLILCSYHNVNHIAVTRQLVSLVWLFCQATSKTCLTVLAMMSCLFSLADTYSIVLALYIGDTTRMVGRIRRTTEQYTSHLLTFHWRTSGRMERGRGLTVAEATLNRFWEKNRLRFAVYENGLSFTT